jgi:ABC-type antimicrobial peptide transport system permease subunit
MASNPLNDPEWATRAVDFIDRIVGSIRKYTTQPLIIVARGIVFGLLAGFGIVVALVLALIGLSRGLQSALDAVFEHEVSVWVSYFILSVIFLVIGIVLMRRRYTPDQES